MPKRSAWEIAVELESRAKSYDIIGNCDDKEFPASVEYHLSAGGDAARHTARLMREAASLLRAGPASEMIDPLRALIAQLKALTEDQSRWSANNLPFTFVRLCAGIKELEAVGSAPVGSPPLEGVLSATAPESCPYCHGTRRITVQQPTVGNSYKADCPRCGGPGTVILKGRDG